MSDDTDTTKISKTVLPRDPSPTNTEEPQKPTCTKHGMGGNITEGLKGIPANSEFSSFIKNERGDD